MIWTLIFLSIWSCVGVDSQSIPTREECSRSYLGRRGHGVITSYNYPFDYLHNLTCTYSIHMPAVSGGEDSTTVICFTFHRFSLEDSTAYCSFDNLMLEYPKLKYCAQGLWLYGVPTTNPESNVWSKDFCWTVKNSQTFDMTFSSDNNINGAGFYAEYFIFPGVENDHVRPPGNLGQAPCESDEWTCFNRRCIPKSLLCDGTDDCGDESDESYAHARCGEQNVLACDFSSGSVSDGYCGFNHEGWFRTKEQHSSGPQGDHTNGSSGFYVYTDVNQSSSYLLGPELTLGRNKMYCLSFWYFIYGRPAEAALKVYVSREQAYSKPEWGRERVPENRWIKGEIPVQSLTNIQVIFAAELDNGFSGVALDDISLLPGSCFGDDLSCNFESGFCGFNTTHDITHHHGNLHGDSLWNLHSRLMGPTGPAYDHSSTDGGGSYLYLNYSTSLQSDNRALLVSPGVSSIPSAPTHCLHFWYHMTGTDRESCKLEVRMLTADNVLMDPVWHKWGDIRNAWKQAFISLSQNWAFQIIIEGSVSTVGNGEIAMDHLTLSPGLCEDSDNSLCEAGYFLCSDGQCINNTLKCNLQPDCLDGSDEDWRANCPSPSSAPASTPSPITPALTPPVTMPTDPRPVPTCSPGDFLCGDGNCVPEQLMCDRLQDCADGSDESETAGCRGVLEPCNGDKFLCVNGRCISRSRHCDGVDDCGDRSDETHCSEDRTTLPGSVCAGDLFQCEADKSCIPRSRVCDKYRNCADGSDESDLAGCVPVAQPSTSTSLSIGAIVGIAIGCLCCTALIILSAILGRKRRKHQPHRHRGNHQRGRTRAAEISTISEPSTMERHMSMLESMRSPMRTLTGLPPYSENNLENMGYTSDGTITLGRLPLGRLPLGVMLPPEEPPPPYDSVIKEQQQDGTDLASRPSTSQQTPGTPDDSYGFRTRSTSGGRGRRKSRERTPMRGSHPQQQQQGVGVERASPLSPLESRLPQPVPPPPMSQLSSPSDESDTANIYEELNVPTLRPGQLRQEPSSSATLQQRNQPLPIPNVPPVSQPGSSLPYTTAAITSSPMLSPVGSVSTTSPPLSPSPGSVLTTSPPLSPASGVSQTRTIPHHRIRLGTQALHNRPQTIAYRPTTTPYNPISLHGDRPVGQHVSYQPLYPPGPYGMHPSPYASIPQGASSPTQELEPEEMRRAGNQIAAARRSLRDHPSSRPDPARLYGSNRNPPPPTHSKPTPTDSSPNHLTQADKMSPRAMPDPRLATPLPNPALSPRVMPNPRAYLESANRFQRPPNLVPSPLQVDNYLYRPRGEHHSTRDWNNASFGSTGSQEQLIGLPAAQHPRAGSNISSDIESTSPLVSARTTDDANCDLELLTPTAV